MTDATTRACPSMRPPTGSWGPRRWVRERPAGLDRGIRAEGQTNIYAGLDQAVQSLDGVTATRPHIILLTDGRSTSGEYDEILARTKPTASRSRRSALAAGPTRSSRASRTRAADASTPASNPATIPDIFLKETQQVSGHRSSRKRSSRSRRRPRRSFAASTTGFPRFEATTARP